MAGAVVQPVIYEEVEIRYDEFDNVWRFTLRGRERSSESLVKAKEAIDKPVPEERKKGFAPIRALFRRYDNVQLGTISSIAESRYGSQQVWFVNDENKKRTKESLDQMCEESEGNLLLHKESVALDKEADTLRKKASAKRDSMKPIKITIPE